MQYNNTNGNFYLNGYHFKILSNLHTPYIGNFRVGLIFAQFATSLKSPKIDTAKNKPYCTSALRVLEIVKIGLNENLTHLPIVVVAKISRCEKFPIYGIDPTQVPCIKPPSVILGNV